MYHQELYFKKTLKFVGEPMSQLESITSSAVHFLYFFGQLIPPPWNANKLLLTFGQVRAAVKVRATCIVVFSSSGRAARSEINFFLPALTGPHLAQIPFSNPLFSSFITFSWFGASSFIFVWF